MLENKFISTPWKIQSNAYIQKLDMILLNFL